MAPPSDLIFPKLFPEDRDNLDFYQTRRLRPELEPDIMSGWLGGSYDSSDDDTTAVKPAISQAKAVAVNSAPDVSTEVWSIPFERKGGRSNSVQDASQLQITLANPTSNALTYNVTYDNLARPVEGPTNPFKSTAGNALKRKNVLTGNAEETSMSEASFKTQHRTFQSLGYTQDPSVNGGFRRKSVGHCEVWRQGCRPTTAFERRQRSHPSEETEKG